MKFLVKPVAMKRFFEGCFWDCSSRCNSDCSSKCDNDCSANCGLDLY